MASKKLERKIRERVTQARKRRIYEKAREVSTRLGKETHKSYYREEDKTPAWDYEGRGIEIIDEPYFADLLGPGHNLLIKYQGKTVFDGVDIFSDLSDEDEGRREGIAAYVPGDWEEELNQLFEKALKESSREKKEKTKAEKEERKTIKEKWGI